MTGPTMVLMLGLFLQGGTSSTDPVAQVVRARESELEELTRQVASELRCPVCQQLSVEDSSSELARDMKNLIHDRLEAGETPDQVKAYFVSKYGEWILLEPPMRGFNLVVWLLPVFAFLGGGVVLYFALRRWLVSSGDASLASSGEHVAHGGSMKTPSRN